MKRNHFFSAQTIFDAFVILLHITFGMSLFYSWFHDPLGVPHRLDIFFVTLIAYLARFGSNFHLYRSKHNTIFILFVILYVADIIQNVVLQPREGFLRIIVLADLVLFMEYVYSIYLETIRKGRSTIETITMGYEFYTFYNIVVTVLCASFIYTGVLSPYDNPLIDSSIINDNVNGGASYFFPGHLAISLNTFRGLSVLGIPLITGLSHEPHVLFYIVGPCFFFLLNRFSNRLLLTILLYFAVLLLLVISTSTTAILVFVIVFVIDSLYKISIGKKKIYNFLVLAIIVILFLWLASIGKEVVDTVVTMLDSKTNTDNSSKDVTTELISYMYTPHDILGYGNMPNVRYGEYGTVDIGFISCILDILFFVTLLVKTIKNVFSRDNRIHYCGMALLYFVCHNMKMGVQTFFFPYLSFFVVLVVILDCEKDRILVGSKGK